MDQKNPFYDPNEDVMDDDEFLRHSRQRPSDRGNNSGNQLQARRRQIEQRTVDSSSRSLSLLLETERVGQTTAEELDRQKEQLRATETRLDEINSTLKQSERHLAGIKSVFGGIRNYFSSASKTTQPSGGSEAGKIQHSSSAADLQAPQIQDLNGNRHNSIDAHPAMRMRNNINPTPQTADDVLDQNLREMGAGLSRLKGLAQNLNAELSDHNRILGRIDEKSSNTSWRMERQNKEMNTILGKK